MTLSDAHITGTALTEPIKKLPRLEELHLYMRYMPEPTDLETIGISCPMLESFSCSNSWIVNLEISEHAVAIGKTMPNLRHLQLIGQRMENRGLVAILDGCPRLESLDLGGCYGLDMQGDLGERCEQLKDLSLHPVSPPSITYQDRDYYDIDSDSSGYDPYNDSDDERDSDEEDDIHFEYH